MAGSTGDEKAMNGFRIKNSMIISVWKMGWREVKTISREIN